MAAPSIAARIKKARTAKPDYRDVDVVIDRDVAEQIEELDKQIGDEQTAITTLEEEKERLTPDLRNDDPRPRKLDEQIAEHQAKADELEVKRSLLQAGTLLTLRFEKMKGEAWAAIAAKHPARLDSTIDRLSGYNYHATAREAAPVSGYALGKNETREDLKPDDWVGLFEIMSGREMENLAASLWELNDFGPRKRVDAARKAFTGGSGSKSS
jgi:DNA repair exonuclease SbcCD ATPase subunit